MRRAASPTGSTPHGLRAAALPSCAGSADEPFDTAAVIGPDWRKVPLHPSTAMALFGLLALAVSGGALLRRGAAPGADVGPG